MANGIVALLTRHKILSFETVVQTEIWLSALSTMHHPGETFVIILRVQSPSSINSHEQTPFLSQPPGVST